MDDYASIGLTGQYILMLLLFYLFINSYPVDTNKMKVAIILVIIVILIDILFVKKFCYSNRTPDALDILISESDMDHY